jgi:hypothetical protein
MGVMPALSLCRRFCAGEVEKKNTHLKALAHADMADRLRCRPLATEIRVMGAWAPTYSASIDLPAIECLAQAAQSLSRIGVAVVAYKWYFSPSRCPPCQSTLGHPLPYTKSGLGLDYRYFRVA